MGRTKLEISSRTRKVCNKIEAGNNKPASHHELHNKNHELVKESSNYNVSVMDSGLSIRDIDNNKYILVEMKKQRMDGTQESIVLDINKGMLKAKHYINTSKKVEVTLTFSDLQKFIKELYKKKSKK